MTDIAEAMARGIAEAMGHRWETLSNLGRAGVHDVARAAIRACQDAGGLVLRKVPGNKRGDDDLSAYQQGGEVGWNNALAAVRALAVEVDHIAEVSKMVIAEPPHG